MDEQLNEAQVEELAEKILDGGLEGAGIAIAPPAPIAITDEAAQREFDLQLIYGSIRQVRESLAAAKLNYALAKAGLAQTDGHGQHPNQLREVVFKQRKLLEHVVGLAREAEEGGIPEPSPLEI